MARNTYENDEILEDKFDAKQLKRLGGYIRPYTGKMLLVLFLMLSSSGLTMFIPKFLQIEMDTYIPNGDIHGIVILTLIAAVIVVYAVVSLRIKVTLTTQVGQDIIHRYERISLLICRNCPLVIMMTVHMGRFRYVWLIMSTI